MATVIFQPDGKDTFLSRMDPAIKIILLFLFSVLVSTSGETEAIAGFALTVLLALSARSRLLESYRDTPFIVLVGVFLMIVNMLNGDGVLCSVSGMLRFFSVFNLAIAFSSSTDPVELSSSLGSMLSRVIGRYGWRFSNMIMLTLSLLPSIFESGKSMLDARRSRCGYFMQHPIRNTADYLVSLFSMLFDRTIEIADALDSRLFDTDARRDARRIRRSDWIVLVASAVISGAIIWIRAL